MDNGVCHQHLETLLKVRAHCDRDDADPQTVIRFLELALQFVRIVMTDATFSRAMKTAQNGEGVLLLANRLQLLRPILHENWPDDFTFDELVEELFGIAGGDAPRILKGQGKQGKFANAHALVSKKLDAHLWYKALGTMGVKAVDRQSLIIESYAVTYDAFLKWRKEAKEKLTPDYVERYLVSALGSTLSTAALQPNPVQWALEQTRQAGADYRHELSRSGK